MLSVLSMKISSSARNDHALVGLERNGEVKYRIDFNCPRKGIRPKHVVRLL